MKKLLATLAIIATAAMPAGAIPQGPEYVNAGQCAGAWNTKCRYSLDIVNPTEEMVQVVGLEYLGPSRLSTVEHCAQVENLDWKFLITDADFDIMEACLIEHT